MNNDDLNIGRIELTEMEIDKLVPADYNPRLMSEVARNGLSNSIDTFGLVQPVIWNEATGNVVGGHQRLNDIIIKGAKTTDVVVVNLSESKEKALNVALNARSIQGEFDDTMLRNILEEIDPKEIMIEDFNLDTILPPDTWDDVDGEDPSTVGEYDASTDGFTLKIENVNGDDKDSILTLVNEALKGTGYTANAY